MEVWFDDIVIATEYIGPIVPKTGALNRRDISDSMLENAPGLDRDGCRAADEGF